MLLHRKHLMRRRGRRSGRNIFGGEAEKLKQFHGVGLRAASTAVLWSLRSLPYSSWRRHMVGRGLGPASRRTLPALLPAEWRRAEGPHAAAPLHAPSRREVDAIDIIPVAEKHAQAEHLYLSGCGSGGRARSRD